MLLFPCEFHPRLAYYKNVTAFVEISFPQILNPQYRRRRVAGDQLLFRVEAPGIPVIKSEANI